MKLLRKTSSGGASKQLSRLLEEDGITSNSEATILRLIEQNPKICTKELTFRNLRVFPLSAVCCFNPSVELVQRVHRAHPEAIVKTSSTSATSKSKGSGKIPLHFACEHEASLAVIEYLLAQQPDSSKTACTENGYLPLHFACWREHPQVDIVKALVAAHPQGVQAVDQHKWSPLHVACFRGASTELIDYLLQVHPDGVKTPSDNGYIPLHYACLTSRASLEVLQTLIAASPDSVKARDKHQQLPLHVACYCRADSLAVIQYLIASDPESVKQASDNEYLPLHYACLNKDASLEVLQYLIASYPESVTALDQYGQLALHHAKGTITNPRVVDFLEFAKTHLKVLRYAPSLVRTVLEAKLQLEAFQASGSTDVDSMAHAQQCVQFFGPILYYSQSIDILSFEKYGTRLPRSRVEVERAIERLETTLEATRHSQDPAELQTAIQAQAQRNLLLPLRKIFPSMDELQERIQELDVAMESLPANDLQKRLELAQTKQSYLSNLQLEQERHATLQQMDALTMFEDTVARPAGPKTTGEEKEDEIKVPPATNPSFASALDYDNITLPEDMQVPQSRVELEMEIARLESFLADAIDTQDPVVLQETIYVEARRNHLLPLRKVLLSTDELHNHILRVDEALNSTAAVPNAEELAKEKDWLIQKLQVEQEAERMLGIHPVGFGVFSEDDNTASAGRDSYPATSSSAGNSQLSSNHSSVFEGID